MEEVGGKTPEILPFEFRQCISIIKSTGKKARNIRELRELINSISDDCIFHHTYQYFLKGHILEYTNDFAQWAGESLEENALSERLSNIDPYDFKDIASLRGRLIRVIDEYLTLFPEPRDAMSGDEFYFNETVTLIFSAGIRARNLAEFLTAMKYIDAASVYYHFYEARTRLGGSSDDFSRWIDPFMHTLDEIKKHIIVEIEEEVRRDMEVIDQCLTGT
jgi:hypothetical protein